MKYQLSACERQERVIDERFEALLNAVLIDRGVGGGVRAGEIRTKISDIPVRVFCSVVVVQNLVLDEREKHFSKVGCVE